MNLWECKAPGCKQTATGVGSGIGLRAIGWYVMDGPFIFCPLHRPDPLPACVSGYVDVEQRQDGPCSPCRAEREAYQWQTAIRAQLGLEPMPAPRTITDEGGVRR